MPGANRSGWAGVSVKTTFFIKDKRLQTQPKRALDQWATEIIYERGKLICCWILAQAIFSVNYFRRLLV